MEISIELVFIVVTAVLTGLLGAGLKGKVIPSYLIPVQNLVIGIVSAFVSVYFKLFADVPTAIFISLAIAFGVGGVYDLVASKKPTTEEETEVK